MEQTADDAEMSDPFSRHSIIDPASLLTCTVTYIPLSSCMLATMLYSTEPVLTRMYGAAEAICHLILKDLRLLQTDGEESSG